MVKKKVQGRCVQLILCEEEGRLKGVSGAMKIPALLHQEPSSQAGPSSLEDVPLQFQVGIFAGV